MAGSRAVSAREPGQIRKEAALSGSAHAPRTSLAGAEDRRARPKTVFDDGCTVRYQSPMPDSPNDVIHELARCWNEGDLDGFAELLHPDIVFLSSENWPETGRWEGRDSMREFWHEFRGVWEDIRLAIDEVHETDDAVAGRAHWITRGRVSGMEGEMEFAITLWVRDGQIVKGQFFEELPDALVAAGLG